MPHWTVRTTCWASAWREPLDYGHSPDFPSWGCCRAVGITFLAVVLWGPSVQPWYLVWGTVILAATYSRRSATGIVWLTVVASFLGLMGLNLLATELGSLGPSLEVLLLAVLVGSAIAPIATYPTQKKSPSPGEVRISRQLRIQR